MASGRVFGTKISLHAAVDMHSRKKKKNRVTHRLPSAGRPRCFLNSNRRRNDRLVNKNKKQSPRNWKKLRQEDQQAEQREDGGLSGGFRPQAGLS